MSVSLLFNGKIPWCQGPISVAELVNSVFINVQTNMAAGACQINMGMYFTNHKLPSLHSESVPRSRLKASTYSHDERKKRDSRW